MTASERIYSVAQTIGTLRRKKDALLESKKRSENQRKDQSKRLKVLVKARVVAQEVAQDTQSKLEYHIAELASISLDTVFPENLAFKAKIEVKRNQTELYFYLLEDGKEMDPTDNSGGAADVIALSLRVTSWSLDPNRPVFILDEPCKFVSPDYQENLSIMIKKISKIMGIQIIMVSHADDINVAANRTFLAKKKGRISNITCLDTKDGV